MRMMTLLMQSTLVRMRRSRRHWPTEEAFDLTNSEQQHSAVAESEVARNGVVEKEVVVDIQNSVSEVKEEK